jgi:short-subunit dehydrogenase
MSYALITGGSKGIGKSIAIELAKKKFDILLVAQNEQDLTSTATELSSQYGVQAYWLSIDLSLPEAAQKVFDWCEEKNFTVQVLVNNAGYGINGAFIKHNISEHLRMMHVNMDALVSLTGLLLPRLLLQPSAYILNISSSAAYQAVPFLSTYAASKAFVLLFSRGLAYELRKTSVSVTCVNPGATDTQFITRAGVTSAKAIKAANKLNMQPDAVAQLAVHAMFEKKPEVITGFINKLGARLVSFIPKKLSEKAAASIYE